MKEFHSFYTKHLQQHGSSAQGVGWKNEEAQAIRFEQLFRVFSSQTPFSINDLGCGVGDFANFLISRHTDFSYLGYDLLAEMTQMASEKYANLTQISFHQIQKADEMALSDYTIASGIFNIRFETADEAWLENILATIQIMNKKSNLGFAFNVLSKYSDLDCRKEELYYADPLYLFDYCKRNFSRNVALLHDYDQYDFTIIIRK